MSDQEIVHSYMGSSSQRWSNWIRPEGIDILEKMGFYDSSWGDDACPSWTHDGLELQVYVDLPVEHSELHHQSAVYTQYALYHHDSGDTSENLGEHILSSNDFPEVLTHISKQSCITGPDGQHACQANGNPCACYCNECECLTDYP